MHVRNKAMSLDIGQVRWVAMEEQSNGMGGVLGVYTCYADARSTVESVATAAGLARLRLVGPEASHELANTGRKFWVVEVVQGALTVNSSVLTYKRRH